MGYKSVCIHCRKAFSEGTDYSKFRTTAKCPECGGSMNFVSQLFQPPKKEDVKAWEVVDFLLRNGFDYSHIYDENRMLHKPYPTTMKEAKVFVEKHTNK